MKNILLATVLYKSPYFENFLKDLLTSIKNQSQQNFTMLFFLDNIEQWQVQSIIEILLPQQNHCFIQNTDRLDPSRIRQELINYAYRNHFDTLIFCDSDETLFPNRIESTMSAMNDDIDFCFCNTVLTDDKLKPVDGHGFYDFRDIPKNIEDITPILSKNFIGLGNLAINLKKKTLYELDPQTLAYDWFIATHMLINGWHGIQIQECLGTYRQHNHNYIGGNFVLNSHTLNLGISVKKRHYQYFSSYDPRFVKMYEEILEVEQYVLQNKEKYIRIINTNFDPKKMCWWENIKTLQEIWQWI